MNRKEFLTSLVGAPIVGIVGANAIQPTAPVYTLESPKSKEPLTPPIDWINGWRHLSWRAREEVLDYWGVEFPPNVMDNMFDQLKSMIGQRIVYFSPAVDDRDMFKELGGDKWVSLEELEKHPPEENRKIWEETCKIGSLLELRENNGIEVRVDIDKKFEVFPFRCYGLYLGIDSNHTHFEPYDEPIDYNKKFVVKSCKVKGLYFKPNSDPNHVDWHSGLMSYYHLRHLDMFMYLPGRAYY